MIDDDNESLRLAKELDQITRELEADRKRCLDKISGDAFTQSQERINGDVDRVLKYLKEHFKKADLIKSSDSDGENGSDERRDTPDPDDDGN